MTSWQPASQRLAALALVMLGLGVAAGCSQTGYRARFFDEKGKITSEERAADFLKVHLRDGRVYVLARWSIDEIVVKGTGRQYSASREVVDEGPQSVPLSDVAIFETNRPETIPRSTAGYVVLGLVTAASLTMTAFCALNPKACFGSCPTFYTHDGEAWKLQAEGFSASIAKPLEETDVDAMWTARSGASGGMLDVQMANEALETHLVDHVRVLAAPRPDGMRIYRSGDGYFAAPPTTAPIACRSAAGDCTTAVAAIDGREYLTAADDTDLLTTETVDVTFPAPATRTNLGVVIAARNSLLNTFVFYQGLSYAGRSAGDWYARLETQSKEASQETADRLRALIQIFGGIRVEVRGDDGIFRRAGEFGEIGPIAREVQLVRLPADAVGSGDVHVRLTMTKGNYKVDHVSLAALDREVVPAPLEPVAVLKDGRLDAIARDRLRPGGARLVTYPGDLYTLRFALPPGDAELFLESRGYYIEWMREQWLTEESPIEVARMLLDPRAAMRALAPRYKRIEGQMEALFWNSRVGVHR